MTGLRHLALVTYDSCRYDVLLAARTPVLDAHGTVMRAQSPGNFTFPAHQAFFVGHLPHVEDDIPYYNRFCRQLMALQRVGETQVAREAMLRASSPVNLLDGLAGRGYQVVGVAAMNWFLLESLRHGFTTFRWTGVDAEAQVAFVAAVLDVSRPFFVFVNFGETHAPYQHRGKRTQCPIDVRAARTRWPPRQDGRVGAASPAFAHQVEAAEFLDHQLGRLLAILPDDTVVVVCADHGDCFGEDGYWGHGFNHPKVLEVPLAIFSVGDGPV
jgi:hypothetical protein